VEKLELQGNLKDFSLEDLLKFVNLTKRTGVIIFKGVVEKEGEKQAKIYCKDGEIIDAEIDSKSGEGAFYYILTIKDGTFAFSKDIPPNKEQKINKKLEELLFEASKQVSTLEDILKKLPPIDTILKVNPTPPTTKISLSKDDWSILYQFRDGKTIKEVRDSSSLGEVETLRAILSLLSANLLIPEEVDIMKIVPEHSEIAKQVLKTYIGLDVSVFPTPNVRANNFFFKVDGKKTIEQLMNEMRLKRKDALSLFLYLVKEGALKAKVSPSVFHKIEEEISKG
jgi:hypothetical protein